MKIITNKDLAEARKARNALIKKGRLVNPLDLSGDAERQRLRNKFLRNQRAAEVEGYDIDII